MDQQLGLLIVLTFIIHLVGTLAYAFRIAGVRSGQIAIAFSLFNLLVLVSRMSNSLQGPLLAKRVETTIIGEASHNLRIEFAIILLAATAASIVGGLLIPTLQRLATRAVANFKRNRSVLALLLRFAPPRGLAAVSGSVVLPRYQNLRTLRSAANFPLGMVALNFVVTAIWTVGVMASVYAGLIVPEFRVTASTLSAAVNGIATVLMFILIDPYLAGLTDDVVDGRASESFYRQMVLWMVLSRAAGTVFAQFLLMPAAYLIAGVAVWI